MPANELWISYSCLEILVHWLFIFSQLTQFSVHLAILTLSFPAKFELPSFNDSCIKLSMFVSTKPQTVFIHRSKKKEQFCRRICMYRFIVYGLINKTWAASVQVLFIRLGPRTKAITLSIGWWRHFDEVLPNRASMMSHRAGTDGSLFFTLFTI